MPPFYRFYPKGANRRGARHRLALLITLLLAISSSSLWRPAPAAAQSAFTCVNKTTTNGVGYANYAVYASGNTIYVGSASYAIFTGKLSISTDGGATFTERTTATGLGNTSVRGITGDGGTVYVATGNGLSISTDDGATFTNKTTTNGLGNNIVWSVYAIGSNVYAGTSGGVSISTDGGATFTNKTTADGLGSNAVWGGVYAAGNTLYAATNGGLAISTDGGATFTNKTTADGLGNNTVRGVYASGNTIYAATDGGLSISTDGGATFTNKTTANGLGNNGVSGVYVSGNTVYAATNGGLSISTDGGATFTNYTTTNGLVGNTVTSVYAVGSTVYVGVFGGLSICTLPTPPVSQVQGKGITIASGDTTPSSADGTDFGGTTIGGTLRQAFTINNTGSADLTSVAVTLSGSNAFSVSDHPTATISPENRLLTARPAAGRPPATDAATSTTTGSDSAGLPLARQVSVNFFINSLRNIDQQHGQFTADFYLDLDWQEPGIPATQDITTLDSATLWHPRPLLVNARKGDFLFESYSNSDDPEYNVKFSTRVIGDFATNFDLRNFPFDQQTLIIELEPKSGNSDEVLFEFIDLNQRQAPSEQPYVQTIPLGRYVDSQVVSDEWALRDSRIAQRLFVYTNDQSSYSRFQIELTLARRAAPYIWKYILPMFLLACFAWSVCLVDIANVVTRFRLLAILLVTLGALHVVLWQALPQTSYLTYLDRLLLLHYTLLLGLIGMVFLDKFLHDRRYLRSALWLNRTLLVGYPLSYVALNVLLYWPLVR